MRNPDSVTHYSARIRSLSSLNNNAAGYAKSDLLRANAFYQAMRYDSAAILTDHLEAKFSQQGSLPNIELLGRTLFLKSTIMFQRGMTGLAKKYANRADQIFRQIGDTSNQVNVSYFLSTLYLAERNGEKALSYALRCLKLREGGDKDHNEIAASLLQISNLYNSLNDGARALYFARKALNLQKKNHVKDLAYYYNAIARVHGRLRNADSAIYYFRLGLSHAEGAGTEMVLFASLNGIAQHLAFQKRYQESNNFINSTFRRFPNLPPAAKTSSDHLKAINYFYLQKMDSAVTTAWSMRRFAQHSSFRSTGIAAASILATIYEQQGRLDSALFYTKEFTSLTDSVNLGSQQDKIGQLYAEIETMEEQRKIRDLNHDNDVLAARNTYLWMLGSFIALSAGILLTGIVIYIRNKQRKHQLENHRLREQLQQRRKDLQMRVIRMLYMNNSLTELFNNLKKLNLELGDRDLPGKIEINREWDAFDQIFGQVYPQFSPLLLTRSVNLTEKDIRMAALIKLDFTNREIAGILAIHPNSVATLKNRLKQKLQLDDQTDVHSYLKNIGTDSLVEV